MELIQQTDKLEEFCQSLQKSTFITVDLEFLREKTYYAKLCLIQIGSLEKCAIIDPLAEGLDLQSFFDLMQNQKVVKVFHSGRQDIEILFNLSGHIPSPIFDTQIAGMATGFGDSASYESLVRHILQIELDKSSRLSDWSRRPLDETQLQYALADVTHLVKIYQYLKEKLHETGRQTWIAEEMSVLSNPETYIVHPTEAWKRIRHRSHNARYLTLLRELAAWREERAKKHNTPRQSIMKDELLLNIASVCPHNKEELLQIRNLKAEVAQGKLGDEILEVINHFQSIPKTEYVIPTKEKELPSGNSSLQELLKLLLKIRSQQENVTPKLITDEEELHLFSSGVDLGLQMLTDWRLEIFGQYALLLREGKLAISYDTKSRQITLTTAQPD